jgi:2-polyprenyl-3-methyl-5-hydroxy-6-metoxy-1,4-benzoquinol methylase
VPALSIRIDFPDALKRQFSDEFDVAWTATEDVVALLPQQDLAPLARRSPGLAAYDWSAYLRCSAARLVRFLRALRRHAPPGGRVLDLGSYFGNISLMVARDGFSVDAVDSYAAYGAALSPNQDLLRREGVRVLDFSDVGYDLGALGTSGYDAVICAGVIEHIPHTPRPILEAVNRVLKPGGTLLLDTPNLAYLYNRQRLARGESIFPPVEIQYFTEIPFEGHHREYTPDEIRWLVRAIGHDQLGLDTFNYSMYSSAWLTGTDAENYVAMERDERAREVIFSVSGKPGEA